MYLFNRTPVFLLDITIDLNSLSSDIFAVSQEGASTGIHVALISHMTKDKPFTPKEKSD